MSLQGDLRTLPVADLVQTLSQRASTGTLVVVQGATERRFLFENGKIVGSASSDPREHLGAFLVDRGLIDQATLTRGMRLRADTGIHLGQVLVTLGAVEQSELSSIMQLKAEKSICALLPSAEGTFEFLENELPRDPGVPARFDPMSVVLASGLRIDEDRTQLPPGDFGHRATGWRPGVSFGSTGFVE